jgi:hypothetical protein
MFLVFPALSWRTTGQWFSAIWICRSRMFRVLLSTTHGGWYRPVFDLFIGACSRFSGFDASGYHAVAFVIYIIVAVLVADVAATLTGNPGVGVVAALLFGIHSAHAEPVLWVSASNELLAGLFTLLSLRSYLAFRASTRRAVRMR